MDVCRNVTSSFSNVTDIAASTYMSKDYTFASEMTFILPKKIKFKYVHENRTLHFYTSHSIDHQLKTRT